MNDRPREDARIALIATAPPPLLGSALAQRLRDGGLPLQQRAPQEQAERWHSHALGGRTYQFAQPITFTPYASARACSARCRFCSENLRDAQTIQPASTLRPAHDYFTGLAQALEALRGVPLSYSLSGLEASDDPDWLLRLLATLSAPESAAFIEQRVLYSNGAGLAGPRGEELLGALRAFGLSWLELSRHHPDAAVNQQIMRFRAGEAIADADVFAQTTRRMAAYFPLRMVCLLQAGGVDSPASVERYLEWARDLGAECVIFRELSRLDEGYRANATYRYLQAQRVPLEELLLACLNSPSLGPALTPLGLTDGYYFWNLRLRHRSGLEVIFECSDYRTMHARHAEGRVYKLVYFADGQLCAGWQPGRDLLLDTRHG